MNSKDNMSEPNILDRLNTLLDENIIGSTVQRETDKKFEYLSQDLKRASKTLNSFKDRFALQFVEPISCAIGLASSASVAYLIRKVFNVKKYPLEIFGGFVIPLLLGSGSSILQKFTNDSLFRLEYNCEQCFQIRTIVNNSVFPTLNSFIFTSMIVWVGDNKIKNYGIFKKPENIDSSKYLKFLFNDYLKKVNKGKLFQKYILVVACSILIAYLFALEQQREFTILFSRYYESLIYEDEIKKEGIDINKNSRI